MTFLTELKWLHDHLPYPFLRLWGSSEKLRTFTEYIAFGGKRTVQYHQLLEKMQEWTSDKIYEFQLARLKKILYHAYSNVPYYKNIFDKEGLKPSNVRCLEDLQKLPIITKNDVLENYSKFMARNLWYKHKFYPSTSGTSGKALTVCRDDNVIAASNAVHRYIRTAFLGHTNWKEATLHSPFVSTFFSLFSGMTKHFGAYSPITNQVLFSRNFVSDEAFKKYVDLIRQFNIKHVEGAPSVFFAFAKYLANKNESINIKTALFSSEILYPFQRKFIEKQLGCEVFNWYGQVEALIDACECCKHDGMHILPLLGVAEINGSGLKGKGEIVMTTLCNYAWPLIRYTTGDVVVLSDKKCECGRQFPRLMSVEGRNNDFIILPSGSYLHSMPFACLNVEVAGVKDLFFLQNEDHSLDVSVVKEEKAEAYKIRQAIESKIKELSRNKIRVRVIFKDFIERKSRKHRVVETKVPAFTKFKEAS